MNFNHLQFRISDYAGRKVEKTVCQFMYKGYEISMSQVFDVPEIAIYYNDTHKCHSGSVEEAIEKIDSFLASK